MYHCAGQRDMIVVAYIPGVHRSIAIPFGAARLPNGEKSLRICLAVSTEYRRVTDAQPDGQMDG